MGSYDGFLEEMGLKLVSVCVICWLGSDEMELRIRVFKLFSDFVFIKSSILRLFYGVLSVFLVFRLCILFFDLVFFVLGIL